MIDYRELIDMSRLPQHIAIIMDGNGRWAQSHGFERSKGHEEGVNTVDKIMTAATQLGIKYLTLYTFSTENWNRPAKEIEILMTLLLNHLEKELFMKNNARYRAIGDLSRLPEKVQEAIKNLEETTKNNTGCCMVTALSYSSKWEITKALKDIAQEVKDGTLDADSIDDKTIDAHMSTNFMPDPELMIRTGGEERLSNFLLWQCAYSEFYFTDKYWPEFSVNDFCQAIYDYQNRQRRFGKTGEQVTEKK